MTNSHNVQKCANNTQAGKYWIYCYYLTVSYYDRAKHSFGHLSFAGGCLPHYSIVCFPRRPLLRLETDKAGSVLSNRHSHREKARPGTPALTSAILETLIQAAFKTHSPVHCGRRLAWQSWCWWGFLRWGPCTLLLPVTKTKHTDKKMQTSTNLKQSTDRDSIKTSLLLLTGILEWENTAIAFFLVTLHGV